MSKLSSELVMSLSDRVAGPASRVERSLKKLDATDGLTGRTRHRVGWFGRMILQVEVRDRCAGQRPQPGVNVYRFRWRDADTLDVAVLVGTGHLKA